MCVCVCVCVCVVVVVVCVWRGGSLFVHIVCACNDVSFPCPFLCVAVDRVCSRSVAPSVCWCVCCAVCLLTRY